MKIMTQSNSLPADRHLPPTATQFMRLAVYVWLHDVNTKRSLYLIIIVWFYCEIYGPFFLIFSEYDFNIEQSVGVHKM